MSGGWLDGLESDASGVVEGAKSAAGTVAQAGAHVVGQGLDGVGLHGAATSVDNWGDSVSDSAGNQVAEQDPGQTNDPKLLVHGDVAAIEASATHLKALSKGFADVAGGLRGLSPGQWRGAAADAFRARFHEHPARWEKASQACAEAAKALETYADTVHWAQGKARHAADLYEHGQKKSKAARDAYNAKVDTYNAQLDGYRVGDGPIPQDPGTFHDPGAEDIKSAQDMLDDARDKRDQDAYTLQRALARAEALAPPVPSAGERLKADGYDAFQGNGLMLEHEIGGFSKAAGGFAQFARSLDPNDPYNAAHPNLYLDHLTTTAAGLVHADNHPMDLVKATVGTGWGKDPGDASGNFLFNVLGLVGSDGADAGAEATEGAARGADDAANARKLVEDDPDGAHDTPDGDRDQGGDPVDLATGRMYLPQTDVELPGVLPLVFTRRTESGCAVGRFLGPAWTSTVDERLRIDAAGVIHITAEGLLVRYPHPAPGAPTPPESGRARTLLARDADGGYTVTSPDSGLAFHFTAPPSGEPEVESEAWLSTITERNGHTITVDRGEGGLPLALVHSAGRQVNLSVTNGLVTALSLAGAGEGGTDLPLMSYGYQDGNLVTVTKPSGATTIFVYDDRRRVTAWIDSNASRYDYVYDDRDRVVTEGGEAGHVRITLDYTDPDPETGHHTTTLTTAAGHATRHLFGPGCRLLAVTDPLRRTTRFTHDSRGNLLTRTDPLGLTTTFSYDEDGRLISTTRPDGSELRTVRGPFGLPVEIVGPDGARTVQEFDERGNRTAVTDPAGSTTRYGYDHAGRVTSITDALGATTRVVCDAAGLPVEVVSPGGGTTRTERDALGRPVRITDPVGAVTRLEWHADGRLARHVGHDGATESWAYDGEGNMLAHTDPSGCVSRYEYTHFDLPLSRTEPDGARYEFEHDADLHLTNVLNPQGLRWSYAYDAAGDLVSETDFDGRTLTYQMDAAGRLAARTDALGVTVAFIRDHLGQVVRKDAGGRVTAYAYDRAGRLLEAAGQDTELRYQYDQRGNVETELVDGRPLAYAYDAVGRRIRRTTPTGHVTTYAYDTGGQPQRLTTGDHRIDFTHDAAGRELSRAFGDTITMTSAWDEAGRLAAQHTTAAGRAVNSRAYSYRADGHLTAVADRLSGTRTFDLDWAGRVTAVHARGWIERYAYDDTGNQTSASWPDRHPGSEATGPRAYTGTNLTRAGDVRFEHDALGRVVLRQKSRLSRKPDTWRYAWDTEGRLTSVTTPDGTQWRYRYDPLGRRTAKQRLAADAVVEEVRFTWDGLTLCEQTTHRPDVPTTVALTWDHRGLAPLAQTERILTAGDSQEEIDRRFFAIATDLIGTPAELIDETGHIAWRTRSTLWGTTAWSRDSTAYTPLRFPGQYYDPETGLHYNLFRHYDPETGRYTSPDPLGLAPAPNPLAYVDNPYAGCDPLGLMPKYTREEKANKRVNKVVDDVIERAKSGTFKKRADYHADSMHGFTDEQVTEILKKPDAVYLGNSGMFTFRKGKDVVIVDGPGPAQGQALTAYGPSGVKGDSGAGALGGKSTDPGAPVTDEDIVKGRIPGKRGFQPPAVRIR